MKLTLGERFALIGLMPQHGNYYTLLKAKELAEKLLPTKKEAKIANIKQNPNGSTTWDSAVADKTKEIKIDGYMREIIESDLQKKDGDGKLDPRSLSLYTKFVKKKIK